MYQQSSKSGIELCILAAGISSRYGATKLLQPLGGLTLLEYSVRAARQSQLGPINLVVGHDQNAIVDVAGELVDRVIINEEYREGIGASIRTAVRACAKNANAILILLADQPLVTANHLIAVARLWSGAGDEIVASKYEGTTGPPILFASQSFTDLLTLRGDTGAKELLENDRYTLRTIEFSPAGKDVDTPADLDGLKSSITQ